MVGVLTLLTPLLLGAFDSGSDGSDGAFNPQFPVVINLADAATGTWDTPSPVAGNGVYDPALWVVVFKYTTIDIPAKVSVTFLNHPSGAPVVWLGSGNVTVSGTVTLNGANAAPITSPPAYAAPGPGGFAGGVRFGPTVPQSGGFGPGGGSQNGPASYAGGSNPYGNVAILPLIGGSGGGGYINGEGGGAGGGAIIIASSENISISAGGSITANGGNRDGYGGSGGAIRLIANAVNGQGQLRARRGTGSFEPASDGRIRIDADVVTLADLGDPQWTTDFAPMPVFPPSNAPTLRIVTIGGQSAPTDPAAGIYTTDTTINTGLPVSVAIEARNIPASTTVNARIVPARGAPFTVASTPLVVQGGGILTATATVTFPPGKAEIQLRANWTP